VDRRFTLHEVRVYASPLQDAAQVDLGDAFLDITAEQVASMLFAVFLGALIGLERELSHKPLGLRTNVLICLGASIFTIASIQMGLTFGGSPERIAAQIVGGIGFLGAGAIIRDRGTVQGATTAATIWLVASLGIACGAGFFMIAMVGTALALFVLFGLHWVEKKLVRQSRGAAAKSTGSATDERIGP
jgi:putative Mg2+ transporter-C (MgtC) family protein